MMMIDDWWLVAGGDRLNVSAAVAFIFGGLLLLLFV